MASQAFDRFDEQSEDDAGAMAASTMPPLLIRYLQIASRRRWLILLLVLVGLSVSIVYTMLQPRLFSATSQVQINREQKNAADVKGVGEGSDPYDYGFYDTQYTLLKSRSLAEKVARDLKLGENKSFFAECFAIDHVPGRSRGTLAANEQAAAGLLMSGISIKPVMNSSLVDVSFTCRSPVWAARIANAWPLTFKDLSMDRRLSATVDARRILEARIEELRVKLEQSERNLIEFLNGNDIIMLATSRDANGKTTETRSVVANNLEAMNNALIAARTARIGAQGASAGREQSDGVSSAIASLREKRTSLRADYARLLVQFEPEHPALRSLQSQIAILDASIANEAASLTRQSASAYRDAVKREADLSNEVARLTGSYRRQQEDQIQLNILQREVDTNRQLFDALLQRYKEIGIASSVEISNILMIDSAKTPGGASSPNLNRNLMMGIFLGFFLAGLVVIGLEQIDEVIREPAEIERKLMQPLLGSVPMVDDDPISALKDPRSQISEAYFSIRTTLDLATSNGFPRVLAVTSTKASEGKSTSAFALAISLARTGRRVLLVDADMRSPSLQTFIEGWNEFGFSNLLSGDDDLDRGIIPTQFENVSALLSGRMPPSASQLLSTDRLKTVIARLRNKFDFVVIDSPPVLALADALLICRAVDGIASVIEADKTTVRSVQASLQRVLVGENRPLGLILTKLDGSMFGYGDMYAYKYGNETNKDS